MKADFSEQIAAKRKFIANDRRTRRDNKGRKVRWSNKAKRRALAVLHPTGNPFLDLCMLKGRFPSTRARFCSQELKHETIFYGVVEPLLEAGYRVVAWQGVRADESLARKDLPERDKVGGGLFNYRPILNWTVDDVLAIHRKHNVPLNPLYTQGCGRVGCMPCIHARKDEIRNISWRFPEEIERVAEWESLVAQSSKRGLSTFFAVDKVPGPHQKNHNLPMPGIHKVVSWSKTVRGGKQFDLMAYVPPKMCSSIYGLCE